MNKLWNDIPVHIREEVREILEGYYGPLGSFDGWEVNQVIRLIADESLITAFTLLSYYK